MKKILSFIMLVPTLCFANPNEEAHLNEYFKKTVIQFAISDIYLAVEMSDMSLEDRNRINMSIDNLETYLRYTFYPELK
jgi:hypothetical protein